MTKITKQSSFEEIAVLVSEALERAGVDAVLGGGGAVSQFSDNEYESADLDFITTERNRIITPTQCVMGRLAWLVHGNDGQSRDQAVLVARCQTIDWPELEEWAASDGIDSAHIDKLWVLAEA